MSNLLPFPFVFAFKETSGQQEVSRRWRGEKRGHYTVACTDGRVLWHWNKKTCTQANQIFDTGVDYVENS